MTNEKDDGAKLTAVDAAPVVVPTPQLPHDDLIAGLERQRGFWRRRERDMRQAANALAEDTRMGAEFAESEALSNLAHAIRCQNELALAIRVMEEVGSAPVVAGEAGLSPHRSESEKDTSHSASPVSDDVSYRVGENHPTVEGTQQLLAKCALQSAVSDDVERLPSVAGRFDRTLSDFERGCLVMLAELQRHPSPDNAVIALLCDAVRLGREYGAALSPATRLNNEEARCVLHNIDLAQKELSAAIRRQCDERKPEDPSSTTDTRNGTR